ncbi:hypothetical protein B0H11DRAFT_1950680 [Mycena galericulata]|nr:hypothetical protein B0H11DRAFT_1950680 [Mycena galericulata]
MATICHVRRLLLSSPLLLESSIPRKRPQTLPQVLLTTYFKPPSSIVKYPGQSSSTAVRVPAAAGTEVWWAAARWCAVLRLDGPDPWPGVCCVDSCRYCM